MILTGFIDLNNSESSGTYIKRPPLTEIHRTILTSDQQTPAIIIVVPISLSSYIQ